MPSRPYFVEKPGVIGSQMAAKLPMPLQMAFKKYLSDTHNYADVTVTSLEKTPKAFALDELAKALTNPVDQLKDSLLMLQGTALHNWLEPHVTAFAAKEANEAGSPQWLLEHTMRLSFPLDPTRPNDNMKTLGGTCDLFHIAGQTLYDYKLVNSFKFGNAAKDYTFQLNAYRVMLGESGYPAPTKMFLIEFARDFSDPNKGGKGRAEYPICVEEVPLDTNVTKELLIKLARERVAYKEKLRAAWMENKPTKATAVATAVDMGAKLLPPCEREYTHEWGVLPAGIPRRCMYCRARIICNQVKGPAQVG